MERLTRLAAAAFVVVGGLVHLELWRSGYRGIPSIGPLFAANVVVSGALALAILAWDDVRVHVGGVVFAAASLAALAASRTVGLLGFTERTWTDAAVQAATAELGAMVALAAVVVAARRRAVEPALVAARAGGTPRRRRRA